MVAVIWFVSALALEQTHVSGPFPFRPSRRVIASRPMDPQIRLLLLEQLLASKGIDIDAELAGVAIGLDGSVVFGAVKPSGEGTGKGETAVPATAAPAANGEAVPAPSATPAAPAPAAAPAAAAPPDILAALTGNGGQPGPVNHDPSNMTPEEQAKYLNEKLLPDLIAGREQVKF